MHYLNRILTLLILLGANIAFGTDLDKLFKDLPHSQFGVKANIASFDNLANLVSDPP